MVRAGPLHGQGRGFESLILHQKFRRKERVGQRPAPFCFYAHDAHIPVFFGCFAALRASRDSGSARGTYAVATAFSIAPAMKYVDLPSLGAIPERPTIVSSVFSPCFDCGPRGARSLPTRPVSTYFIAASIGLIFPSLFVNFK